MVCPVSGQRTRYRTAHVALNLTMSVKEDENGLNGDACPQR
jgi:hypothetical protein